MAAALRSAETRLAVVTSLEEDRPSRLSAWVQGPRLVPSPARKRARREWPVAALLAASLVVGVMLGSAGTFDTTVQDVAEAAGMVSTADAPQLALGEDILTAADEDLL